MTQSPTSSRMAQPLWQVLPIWVISSSTVVAHLEPGPHRQVHDRQTLHREVLGKIAGLDLGPRGHHLVDGLPGQEAHLADAAFGVGVAGQAVLHQQPGLVHVVLDHALAVADGDGVDAAAEGFS